MSVLPGIQYLLFFIVLLPWSESIMLDFNWPKMKMGLKRFPHQESCSHFYSMDASGEYALKQCPDGQHFDYISLICTRETLAHCWSNMLDLRHKPMSRPERDPFKCPFAWGTYPDIKDCSKYFTCHGGKAHHKKCPLSKRFDKVKEKCVSEGMAVCADESDIVEKDYKCPYSWGAFSFSKDCSKYYECFDKKPILLTCKPGDLFDLHKKQCDAKEVVDCQTRYNPFDKKTTMPDTNPLTSGKTLMDKISLPVGEISNKPTDMTAKVLNATTVDIKSSLHSISEITDSKASVSSENATFQSSSTISSGVTSEIMQPIVNDPVKLDSGEYVVAKPTNKEVASISHDSKASEPSAIKNFPL